MHYQNSQSLNKNARTVELSMKLENAQPTGQAVTLLKAKPLGKNVSQENKQNTPPPS
jgi:hypothetical protein